MAQNNRRVAVNPIVASLVDRLVRTAPASSEYLDCDLSRTGGKRDLAESHVVRGVVYVGL